MVRASGVAHFVLAVLCFAACTPQPRVFAEPAVPAAGVKDKRVTLRVAHEGKTSHGAIGIDFDNELVAALRQQLEADGLEVRRDTKADEAVLDVRVLFDSPVEVIGDRAVFRYYLAKAGRSTTIHSFEESGIAPQDIDDKLTRAAAIRIVNEVVTKDDMVDILKRFANSAMASTEHVPAGTKSVLALPMRAAADVAGETITAASAELNTQLAERNVFKVIKVNELSSGSTAERDIAACNTVACTAEIGRSLGVAYVGYGTLGTIGTQYAFTYITVDTATTHVVGRINRNVPRDDAKLMGALEGMAGDIAQQWATAAHVN